MEGGFGCRSLQWFSALWLSPVSARQRTPSSPVVRILFFSVGVMNWHSSPSSLNTFGDKTSSESCGLCLSIWAKSLMNMTILWKFKCKIYRFMVCPICFKNSRDALLSWSLCPYMINLGIYDCTFLKNEDTCYKISWNVEVLQMNFGWACWC